VVALEDLDENRVQERLLRREAAVEGAGPDACGTRDLVHAGVEPLHGEEPARGVEDPLAVRGRVSAQGRLRLHAPYRSEKWR
jgi:hypothetical protein